MLTSKQMVEIYRAGSLVWVQRKHGTWWPGRIVGPTEIPPLFMETFECSLSSSKLPIMLLGRSSNSLEWHNMESKRVKPFRCGEFDHCIEEAELCKSSIGFNEGRMYGDTGKRAHREDAILHALAIERKERQKNLKREGHAQPESKCRGKRLKFTCVPVKSQSLTVVESPVRPESSPLLLRIKTASSETLPHYASNDQNNSAESLGHSQRKLRSMTVKKQGQSINWSKSPNCHTGVEKNLKEKQKERGAHCDGGDASTNKKMPALEKCLRVMADPLAPNGTSRGVKQTFVIEAAENTDINSIHSEHTIQQEGNQTMWVEVDITVEQISHGGHVPFICMISKASQKPIIGHPVDIEVVDDSSDIFLGKTNGIAKPLFGRAPVKVPKLVWRTAKRTPVCYSLTSDTPNTSVATQSFTDSKAKGRSYPRAPESLSNNFRKHTKSSDHTLLHAVKNQAPVNASSSVNCVPVKHIFSRLLAAVG